MKRSQRLSVCWFPLLAVLLCGCADMLPIITPFGAVTSPDQFRTLNGLGVHRRMWESTGAKVLTPQKLSPKLETFDVIVMVGQSYAPPGKQAREWLETWLRGKRGRSVIYFGRDFNADIYYRQQTLAELPPELRGRGEELLALEQAQDLSQRLEHVPESTFCGWFYLDASQPPRTHTRFTGDWSSQLAGLEGTWPTGLQIKPPSRSQKNPLPSWLLPTAKANPLKPASTFDPPTDESRRSTWTVSELDSLEQWNAEFKDLPTSETLLAGSDGEPLVFRLTDADAYPGSQILVSINGAPLLNGSLVEPVQQRIGERLIQQCLPASRVALIAYGEAGLLISNTAEADARGAGLEMLMVWPLSAITMPAALLGIIVCTMLIPILGRPQSLPRRSISDFGLHIEALGQMLFESRDLEYAKSSIAAYFRQVRGEPPPGWLAQVGPRPTTALGTRGQANPSPPSPSEPASPPQAVTPVTAPHAAAEPPDQPPKQDST